MNNLDRAKELLKEGGNQIDGIRVLIGKNNETLYLFRCKVKKKTFRWLFIEKDGNLSKPTIISSSERKKIGRHFGKGRGKTRNVEHSIAKDTSNSCV